MPVVQGLRLHRTCYYFLSSGIVSIHFTYQRRDGSPKLARLLD